MAYDRLDPIGAERGDWQAALVAAVMANAFCGKGRPLEPKDFKLRFGPPEPMDPEEIEKQMTAWAKQHNKRLRRRRGDHHRKTRRNADR